ncbi:UBX domain-containing protein 7 isoform X2 [Arvicanthis niloticus]|uniref:UBX domain-containing protein 7 isoform X2 n=1 Tax=Arvicanthis niloticus TaxID=61156 RepID=UPI00402BC9AE
MIIKRGKSALTPFRVYRNCKSQVDNCASSSTPVDKGSMGKQQIKQFFAVMQALLQESGLKIPGRVLINFLKEVERVAPWFITTTGSLSKDTWDKLGADLISEKEKGKLRPRTWQIYKMVRACIEDANCQEKVKERQKVLVEQQDSLSEAEKGESANKNEKQKIGNCCEKEPVVGFQNSQRKIGNCCEKEPVVGFQNSQRKIGNCCEKEPVVTRDVKVLGFQNSQRIGRSTASREKEDTPKRDPHNKVKKHVKLLYPVLSEFSNLRIDSSSSSSSEETSSGEEEEDTSLTSSLEGSSPEPFNSEEQRELEEEVAHYESERYERDPPYAPGYVPSAELSRMMMLIDLTFKMVVILSYIVIFFWIKTQCKGFSGYWLKERLIWKKRFFYVFSDEVIKVVVMSSRIIWIRHDRGRPPEH